LVAADVPEVTRLLNGYLNKCQLAPVFDEDEVAHWLTPRAGVVDSYVVAEQKANGSQGPITDLCSFYHLPSTVIGHATHNQMKAAYSFYNVPRVPTEERWTQLMGDALVAAKNLHMDVFNALNVMDNERFLKVLKFGEGDGHLQYYLYNWRVSRGALARTTSTRTHACFHFASTAGLVHAVFGKAHICWLSSACVCMCVSARP
jgi:glycylpeptide N-tetradecanoyltransferase